MEGEPLEEEGIVAIARVMEHIHLGWAWFGWLIRLPLINYVAQLLVEWSFDKPLAVCKRTTSESLSTNNENKGGQH